MSKEELKEERLLVYRETTNEMGEVGVVCYDQVTSELERSYGYDENGRLHGFYQKWDRDGNLELMTKYQHGIEMGPRVAKLRGLSPNIWEHSSMGENGLWGEVVYSRSPYTTYLDQLVPKAEVQELLEAHAAERRERADARKQFSPRNFVSEAIWDTLDDLMVRMELNDYSFSDEVKEIFRERILDYDSGESFFENLAEYGAGDMLCDFVYYSQTKDFYLRNMDDIEKFAKEIEEELGQPLSLEDPRYHYLSRLVVEELGRRIGDDFQYVFYDTALNNAAHLFPSEVKELMENCDNGEVADILQDYISFFDDEEELEQEILGDEKSLSEEPKKINVQPPSDKKKGRSLGKTVV